jgi:hypothetical protein
MIVEVGDRIAAPEVTALDDFRRMSATAAMCTSGWDHRSGSVEPRAPADQSAAS